MMSIKLICVRAASGLCMILLWNHCNLKDGEPEKQSANYCTKFSCASYIPTLKYQPSDTVFYTFGPPQGIGPVTYSILSGSLPSGVELTSSGNQAIISGTISSTATTETKSCVIEAKDDIGSLCKYSLNFNISSSNTAQVRTNPPDIVVQVMVSTCGKGKKFAFTPSAIHFRKFVWMLKEGAFPPGVVFNPETGEISGETDTSFNVQIAPNDANSGAISSRNQTVSVTISSGEGSEGDGGGGSACGSTSCSGTAICVSGRTCIKGNISGNCDCNSKPTTGECADYVSYGGFKNPTSCSSSGGSCGNLGDGNYPLCCPGLSCNNGTCEGSGGRCPF